MTPQEIVNKIDSPEIPYEVYNNINEYLDNDREDDAIIYLQDYFKCTDNIAKETLLLYKETLYAGHNEAMERTKFMTAHKIYEQIENLAEDQNGHYVVSKLIQAYYYADKVPEVIVYIQEVFKCDEDMAKEVFEIFKKENAQHLLTPEQAAANQAACEAERLAQQKKPKCPTCQSTNVQKLGQVKEWFR